MILQKMLQQYWRKKQKRQKSDKSIAYKLLSNIEAITNLKVVLEAHVLKNKIEFTFKEI